MNRDKRLKKPPVSIETPQLPTMDYKQFAKMYQNQSRNFRIMFSGSLLVFSIFGIWMTDLLQKKYPAKLQNNKDLKSKVDLEWKKEIEIEVDK
jgi:cytosine/uracil/thiamine/allantoin permease